MAKTPSKSVTVQEDRIDPETGEVLNNQEVLPPSLMGSGQGLDMPMDSMDLLEKYSGAGYSDKPEDGLTPILSIIQNLSGEIKKTHERYMEGVEVGEMIIRSLRQVYPGDPGIIVQPFGYGHKWVEWQGEPGDGIPVGQFLYEDPPQDLYEAPDPANPKNKIRRRKSNGNRLVDTREHYVNIVNGRDRPFSVVIPMSGSNHGCSRLWTNMMRNMVYQGRPIPSFFRLYNLKTVFRKKGSQDFYSFNVDPGPFIKDRELLQLGASSFDAIKVKPIEGNLSDMGADADDTGTSEAAPVNAGNII